MAGFYQLRACADGQFIFHLMIGSHGALLTSPSFPTMQAARGGIESARKNSRLAARFVRLVENESACHFVVLSDIGQVVATSKTFSSRAALEEGLKLAMTYGATTVIRQPGITQGSTTSKVACHATDGKPRNTLR